MILHVAGLDKFIPPFVELIRDEFSKEVHQFWLSGSIETYPVEMSDNIYLCGDSLRERVVGYAMLVRQLHASQKIVVHGLFNMKVVVLLALFPWLLHKCYWVIWGGDLYRYKRQLSGVREKISEKLRRFVIRRIGHLVTYLKGDVDLARKWYGATGVHHECIMYLSNVVDSRMINVVPKKRKSGLIKILVGNSSDPENNHFEILDMLAAYKKNNIEIFVPLSYGDRDHARKVIDRGKELFGEKFFPLTDFIPFEQYYHFLKGMDIAIFGHRRQQAMGNTITLLGMGKTVYMRSDVSQWDLFAEEGISVFDIQHFDLDVVNPLDAEENMDKVKLRFSRKKLIEQYSRIFNT